MNFELSIERPLSTDIDAIVSVHTQSFPYFFLTTLGPRFLRSYYSQILKNKNSIFIIAKLGNEIVGFVSGFRAYQENGIVAKITNARFFVIPIIVSLLFHPILIVKRLMSFFSFHGNEAQIDENSILLSSVAVLPSFSNNGIGGAMFNEFERMAKYRGYSRICLTTDVDSNESVLQFYHKCGFLHDKKFMQTKSRSMYLLKKNLF